MGIVKKNCTTLLKGLDLLQMLTKDETITENKFCLQLKFSVQLKYISDKAMY